MKSLTAFLSLIVFVQLLSGCRSVNSMQGFPHNGLNTKKSIKARYANFKKEDYESKYYAAGVNDATKQEIRDNYIRDRKALIDAEYVIFLERLSGVKDWKDFGKTVAVGTMGVVGGLVGGGTAQLLSAASGATTLSDAAVDSVFFYNATLPAMKAGMDAARAVVLVDLTEGMTNTVGGYNLGSAEGDMDKYYFAGTLLGAASQIQKDAASTTTKGTEAANAVKGIAAIDKENATLNQANDAAKITANNDKKKVLGEQIQKFNSR